MITVAFPLSTGNIRMSLFNRRCFSAELSTVNLVLVVYLGYILPRHISPISPTPHIISPRRSLFGITAKLKPFVNTYVSDVDNE